jgi:GMP synthase-like glutamine amidotransferase
MHVTFLQHHALLPPGHLGEYLVRRHAAVVRVLMLHEARTALDDMTSADLVVSLGSSVSAYRTDVEWVVRERQLLSELIRRERPVIGICYGAQLLTLVAGGDVTGIGKSFVGWLENDKMTDPVWKGPWFRFHCEQCLLPPSAEVLARSQGIVQAFQYGRAVGVQFHPEVDLETVAAMIPHIQSDFGLQTADSKQLQMETRTKVASVSTARERLFDEIMRRCFKR